MVAASYIANVSKPTVVYKPDWVRAFLGLLSNRTVDEQV